VTVTKQDPIQASRSFGRSVTTSPRIAVSKIENRYNDIFIATTTNATIATTPAAATADPVHIVRLGFRCRRRNLVGLRIYHRFQSTRRAGKQSPSSISLAQHP
jgi:hypothetical protein